MMMMHTCQKCSRATSLLILALGVLFLLVDWNVWDFWGISWWSAILVIMGITGLAKSAPQDVESVRPTKIRPGVEASNFAISSTAIF